MNRMQIDKCRKRAIEGLDTTGPDIQGPDIKGPDIQGPDSQGPDGEGQNVQRLNLIGSIALWSETNDHR